MTKLKASIIFICLLLLPVITASAAEIIRLTNQGNSTVRLKCDQLHGRYKDIYLKPGESAEAPPSTTVIELAFDYGQWAQTPQTDIALNVLIRKNGRDFGRIRAFGDELRVRETPPDQSRLIEADSLTPLSETTRERYKEIENSIDRSMPHWPWFAQISLPLLLALIFLLLLPFLLAFGRSLSRPGFTVADIPYQPLGFFKALFMSVFFAGLFGGAAYWGYHKPVFLGSGFLLFFLQDLALLPIWILSLFSFIPAPVYETLTESCLVFTLIAFWSVIFLFFFNAAGRWRAPTLMMVLLIVAILSMLPIWRAFQGVDAYAWIDSHPKVNLYPGVFTSLFLLPLLFLGWLYCRSPYHGYYESFRSDQDFVYQTTKSGCFFPLTGILLGVIIAILGVGHALFFTVKSTWAVYILDGFARLPLMIGLTGVPYIPTVFIFWILFCAVTGFAIGRYPARNRLVLTSVFALLVLIFLTASYFPGKSLISFLNHYKFWMNRSIVMEPVMLKGSTGQVFTSSRSGAQALSFDEAQGAFDTGFGQAHTNEDVDGAYEAAVDDYQFSDDQVQNHESLQNHFES